MPSGDSDRGPSAAETLREILEVLRAAECPPPAALEICGVVRIEFAARPGTLPAVVEPATPLTPAERERKARDEFTRTMYAASPLGGLTG